MDASLSNEDLAPTTSAQRTWSWWHIASLWIGMAICIPTYTLAGGLVEEGWSWQAAVLSVAIGNVIVLVPMLLNAHPGARYGIPFPVLLRSSFGVLGANIPAVMRALVACGWFGIQTWIGGAAIYQLLRVIHPARLGLPQVLPEGFGIGTGEFLCFLAFWALNVGIIVRGMDSIKVLESWSAPILIIACVMLFVGVWSQAGSLDVMLQNQRGAQIGVGAVFGAGITAAVGFWGTLALNIPDFARYARSQKDQIIGQSVGLPPTMAGLAFIGATVTNAVLTMSGTWTSPGKASDPLVVIGGLGGPWTIGFSIFALIVATLSTNLAANVVGPANDFSNLAPRKINFRRGALITAGIGLVMMPWKLYNDAAQYLFTWLLGYGACLGAVAGVMIADYYVIRRRVLDLDALYSRGGAYEYKGGFNPVAIVALTVGIAPNVPGFLGALGVVEVSALFKTIYTYAWFVAFLLAAVVHVVGMRIVAAAPPITAPNPST